MPRITARKSRGTSRGRTLDGGSVYREGNLQAAEIILKDRNRYGPAMADWAHRVVEREADEQAIVVDFLSFPE